MQEHWQEVTQASAGLCVQADAYTHWALGGGHRHLWPAADGTAGKSKRPWVSFLVEWAPQVRCMDAVRALRRRYREPGAVQVTTLPGNLAPDDDFPFAVISVRLRRGVSLPQGIAGVADVLGRLGAVRLELSLPLRERPERRSEGASPAGPDTAPPRARQAAGAQQAVGRSHAPHAAQGGPIRVLGVIDDVIPYGHAQFKSQVHAVWLQGEDRHGHVNEIVLDDTLQARPAPVVLRRDFSDAGDDQSDSALTLPQRRHVLPRHGSSQDLHQVAVDLGFPAVRRRESHGAHVIGLALAAQPVPDTEAGHPDARSRLAADGPAPQLVGVQLPWEAVQDTSGRWLGGHLLAGLVYTLDCTWWMPGRRPSLGGARAGDDPLPRDPSAARHLVVNISYGHTTGPHDGSSLIERAMDALCERFDGSGDAGFRLDICLPAGNAFSAQAHAARRLSPGAEEVALCWRVLPDGHRPAFLELWLRPQPPGGHATVALTIRSPAGHTLQVDLPVDGADGAARQWQLVPVAGGPPVAHVRAAAPEAGARLVLVALEPTALDRAGQASERMAPAAPPGDWQIVLAHRSGDPVDLQAYVARSTPHLYSRRDGTLSWLVDPQYDPDRYLRRREADEAGQTVQRLGTLSGVATGQRTQVATGRLVRGREGGGPPLVHAPYASAGPGLDAAGRQPDVGLPTEASRGLPGVRSRGNQDATQVRLSGTSSAAPQWARQLLLAGGPASAAAGPRESSRSGSGLDPALFGRLQR